MSITKEQFDKIDGIKDYIKNSYSLPVNMDNLKHILNDRACIFYPVKMVFDEYPLKEGEFAYMHQADSDPNKGFMLYMHPYFKEKEKDLPFLVVYQLAVVNFGSNVHFSVAEVFGAALMDMNVEEYYDKVNSLYESLMKVQNKS